MIHRGRVVGTWSLERGEVSVELRERVPKAALAEEIERVERAPTSLRMSERVGPRPW